MRGVMTVIHDTWIERRSAMNLDPAPQLPPHKDPTP